MKISKKQKDYLIIIILILFFVFLTYRFKNVFGSDTDWINQHTIIPDYFRQMFYKTGKLIPNLALNYGAGQNIFNISYYGLLSPLILPSYFFPFMSMPTYITIINIITLIASGILFYNFLESHKYKRNVTLLTTIIFVLAAPFIFHMHRHIMFVNYMPFLVMGLMGVDKYLNKKKKGLLIISIFLMIMTSYYYSVCGLMVIGIYYLHEYLNKKEKFDLKLFFIDLIKFVLVLMIPILLSGILLIPTMYTLFSGRSVSESAYKLKDLLIPDMLFSKIFNGTYAIGLSIIGFISLLYLFFTKKRNNIIMASLLSIILFFPIFRFLLNGGLYLREKCFIPFIPLFSYYIAYFLKDLFNKKIDLKKFSIYLTIVFVLLYYFNQVKWMYGLILVFIICLLLYKKYHKNIIIYLIILSIMVGTSIYEVFKEDEVLISDYNKIFSSDVDKEIVNAINNDSGYYRFSNLYYPTKTVNKIYHEKYLSTNFYSSTYNGDYLDFIRNDFPSNEVEYNNFLIPSKSNLLWNSYMGVKYVYSDYDLSNGYTKISNNIYLNNYALPLIYARSNYLSIYDYKSYNYPYNEAILLNNVITENETKNPYLDLNMEKVHLDYEIVSINNIEVKEDNGYDLVSKDNGEIIVKFNDDIKNKLLYINVSGLKENTCSIDNISMKINNEENILTCKSWIYPNHNNTFHYILGDNNNTLTIKLLKGTYHIDNIETYLVDYQNIINKNYDSMNIISIENDEIIGDITVKDDSYLVTSIPYDKGFKIFIDDKEVPIEKINKAFLGCKITQGEHHVKITYQSPWLNYGKIASILGLLLYIGIIVYDKKKKISS